jgi:hypothetical protein
LCPVCQLEAFTISLKKQQDLIEGRGGIIASRYGATGKVDPTDPTLKVDPVHLDIMGGPRRKRSLDGLPATDGWWRSAKCDLSNYELKLEALKEAEVEWEGELFVRNVRRSELPFDNYSATKAREHLENYQHDYKQLYVFGDPALSILEKVADDLLEKEQEAADRRAQHRKRRKISHRFNETVTVSGMHSVDEPGVLFGNGEHRN